MSVITVLTTAPAWSAELAVGQFSKSSVQGWAEKSFSGHTQYALTEDDGRTVLAANSKAAASGYFKKIEIDLQRTPYLNWSWKVENILAGSADERSKKGDDYPARIYVVFSNGPLFWKTQALNYVWSSSQLVGVDWANAFAGSAHMIAVEAGKEHVGQWQTYKRNIREDYKKYFGADVTHAQAVAVMTDTDNTQQSASAFFGDIFFTNE